MTLPHPLNLLTYLRREFAAEREKRRQLIALWRDAMRLGGKKR